MERALIVRKEWLDKILDGVKVWEMRSTPTKIRGRIGLIEAGTGLIVGECELVDSLIALRPHETDCDMHFNRHQVDDSALLEKWCHPWVLESAKRYDKPIPYDHPKGAVIWVKL
jgi:hypothetical protein